MSVFFSKSVNANICGLFIALFGLQVGNSCYAQSPGTPRERSTPTKTLAQSKKAPPAPTSFLGIAFDRAIFESKPKCAGQETYFDFLKAASERTLPQGGCAFFHENEGRISSARLLLNEGESIVVVLDVLHDDQRKPTQLSGEFPRRSWNSVKDALTTRFGSPTSRTSGQLQNVFGVSVDSEQLIWEWPTVMILAASAKNLTDGSLMFATGEALTALRKKVPQTKNADVAKTL